MDRCSILLIEDNPHDAELTLLALGAGCGAEVKVTSSGREALDYLGAHGGAAARPDLILPDLILLDLNMPQMNGLEVLDALRAGEQTRDIPVVVLTTSSEERDQHASYAHGASDYVVKALDLDQFREALTQVQRRWLSPARTGPLKELDSLSAL